MANLPETDTFDAGVYQIETTDAVVGGAGGKSNASAINLANRTSYLKKRIESLLSKSVAGAADVTLTASEANNAILELTGVLTGNINLIVPVDAKRQWLVKNSTSGAFSITVKTAAGTGVVAAQSATTPIYTDGTNVEYGETIVTQAEAEARTATTSRGWSALRVGQAIAAGVAALVVQATEAITGIAKVATQAQTNAGTNDATIVTPKKLLAGFTVSLGNNGYIIAPEWFGGWILQWVRNFGTNTSDGAGKVNITVTFPIAFPTAVYGNVFYAVNETSNVEPGQMAGRIPSLTGVVLRVNGTASTAYAASGFAIGK